MLCDREPSERQPCDDRPVRDCADAVVEDGDRRKQHAVRPHYFYESRFAEWKPYDVASIRAEGGSCGNGSEGLVCSEFIGGGIAAPIDASYYKGQGLRQGIEREYVIMKPHVTGNGQLANSVIDDKTVGTLDCMHDQKMVIWEDENMEENKQERKYVLRRLTPTECARLQGFPDWWCDGANGSDSAQYKLWGNGVALPCVAFIMDRIVNGECVNG